jgi:hypothetical protein
VVAVVVFQQVGNGRLEQGDLGGQPTGERAQRSHLPRIRLGQHQAIRPDAPACAEDVGAGYRDTELGQDGVNLVLQLVRSRTSLIR